MNDSNILTFPSQKTRIEQKTHFSFQPEIQYTSSGLAYRFLDILSASVSPLALESSFQSEATSTLYYSQRTGIDYFREICRVLPFSRIEKGSTLFLLPQTTLTRISQEVKGLNIFECKKLMREIDTHLEYVGHKSCISAYNYIRSIIYNHHQDLLP